MMVFDLDPGPPATIVECCRVGLILHGMFENLGLKAFPKTSGNKGMQVYVPLNVPDATYEQTKGFSRAVAETLEAAEPDLVVSRMAKALRGGKIFIDYSQNDEHKTTVGVYSLRARERPTVSTPLEWDEVRGCLDAGDPRRPRLRRGAGHRRIAELGDLFAPVRRSSSRSRRSASAWSRGPLPSRAWIRPICRSSEGVARLRRRPRRAACTSPTWAATARCCSCTAGRSTGGRGAGHRAPREDFRVVALDLRGFGWSEATPRGYRKEELADDVVGVLDALGLDRVNLVGHDWGGVVGFHRLPGASATASSASCR